jgi:RNA 2',3'-cyclic 3'-phosphodiesterase
VPRLFVAVTPPDDVLDALGQLPRVDEPGVRWTRRDHWHVTLRFLGEAEVDHAAAALERLRASATTVELGPSVSRLGRNVICLPASGLDDVAGAVRQVTEGVGEPPDPRPFSGHLTLARLKHRGACRLAGTPFSASFVADGVELVRSRLSDVGPTYSVELRVPLGEQ